MAPLAPDLPQTFLTHKQQIPAPNLNPMYLSSLTVKKSLGSFSQGLKLQQTYGGGLGFVVFKSLNRELDFKASADYIDQRFETPGLDQKLFGSIFGETYIQNLCTESC
jgi:hypothetical protein